MTTAEAGTGPLAGLTVLDTSTILAGPLIAQMLGDYGAEVIKIEHPTKGDGMRGHGLSKNGVPLWWKMISRNKRSVALDLGSDDGAAAFRRLAQRADVVIENFRPGTFERWGLSYETLAADNPGLILARVTGFGQEGPYASRPAFGTLVEAMSGFAHLTGQADGPPTLPAFGLADSIAGLAGTAAVTTALFERERSGQGQVIDLNLLAPITMSVGPGMIYADQLGIDQQRTGNRSSNNAPRNTYLTRDGHWVAISTSANSIAERVMTLVGHPEVVSQPWFATGRERAQHADLLDAHVGTWIGERDLEEVMSAFAQAGAAVAPVYRPSQLLVDEQVVATQLVTDIEDEDFGRMRMNNVLWGMSRTPGAIRFTGRALGQDSDEVLGEVGYTPAEISDLRRSGAIA